jgi:hypothetical protein
MNMTNGKKYPILRKGKAGYWHAYGNGWAVCAPTKELVQEKYREMLELINELIARPVVKSSDAV